MMICHCQSITDHDIRAAVDWMRAADPETIITPGKIYHALGKRADCGGCMPLFLATMQTSDKLGVPTNLRGLGRRAGKDRQNEGRPEGHRLSERRAAF